MSVRIGVIGGGKFGGLHLQIFSQLMKRGDVELVGLADLNENLLNQRKKEFGVKPYTDYRKMIEEEKPDAVSVATPDHLHRKIAVDVLNMGVNVLVEKPLDITVEGCLEIIETAEKNNKFLQVDFHKRFDPASIEVYNNIKQGNLGEILYATAYMNDKIEVPSEWFKTWAHNSSSFWFLGSHLVDLLMWLTGKKPKEVIAVGQKEKLKSLGIDTYDYVNAIIKNEDGSSFLIETNWIQPENFESIVDQGFKVVGTDGNIEVDAQDRGIRGSLKNESGTNTFNPYFHFSKKNPDGTVTLGGYGVDSIIDFVNNIRYLKNGMTIKQLEGTYASGRDGMLVTAVCEAVSNSLKTGKPETVNTGD